MHLCPDCYSVCRCCGDADDIDSTGYVACTHFLRPECGADNEDWEVAIAHAPLESRREDWEAAMNEVDSDVGTQGSGRKA